jgi:hypothetical protein
MRSLLIDPLQNERRLLDCLVDVKLFGHVGFVRCHALLNPACGQDRRCKENCKLPLFVHVGSLIGVQRRGLLDYTSSVRCTNAMNDERISTAIYLAGHGSKTKPRLIELQYQRIQRYRRAFINQFQSRQKPPAIFLDLRLPRFGMGLYDLDDVPGFKALYEESQRQSFKLIYIDIDDTPNRTPDHESEFIRELLEKTGAVVLNAFTDDKRAFSREVKDRCGENAKVFEVTEDSDFVNFFPSLASDIATRALEKEIESNQVGEPILKRIDYLKDLRPYSGGGAPFVENRLSARWRKQDH